MKKGTAATGGALGGGALGTGLIFATGCLGTKLLLFVGISSGALGGLAELEPFRPALLMAAVAALSFGTIIVKISRRPAIMQKDSVSFT